MAKLEVLNGKSEGEVFELEENEVIEVGTKRKAGLRLRDRGISYVHAVLTLKNEVLVIEDRHSGTGTWVGDEQLGTETHDLADGKTFRMGDIELRFTLEKAAPEADKAPEAVGAAVEDSAASAELAAKNQELEAALKKTEEERKTLSFERDKLNEELEKVKEDLAEAEEIASSGVEELNDYEARIEKLESELKDSRAESGALRQELSGAVTRVQELEAALITAETSSIDAQERLAKYKSRSEKRVSQLEKKLERAKERSERAPVQVTALGQDMDSIQISGNKDAVREGALAAFDPAVGASANGGGSQDSLEDIQAQLKAAREQNQSLRSEGAAVPLTPADFEVLLRERDEALHRLRDDYRAKCDDLEDLNEEYQQVVEELEEMRK